MAIDLIVQHVHSQLEEVRQLARPCVPPAGPPAPRVPPPHSSAPAAPTWSQSPAQSALCAVDTARFPEKVGLRCAPVLPA